MLVVRIMRVNLRFWVVGCWEGGFRVVNLARRLRICLFCLIYDGGLLDWRLNCRFRNGAIPGLWLLLNGRFWFRLRLVLNWWILRIDI